MSIDMEVADRLEYLISHPEDNPDTPLTADPQSAEVGILLLHGFTGSPYSMKPLARLLIESGKAVRVPVLPGHGTSWRDLNRYRWNDWLTAAHHALAELTEKYEHVIVLGLSMGATLTAELATSCHGLTGIVCVNPALAWDKPIQYLVPLLSTVLPVGWSIANDIARPGTQECAYTVTPLKALASLQIAQKRLRHKLWKISTPTILCLSSTDRVVATTTSEILRASLLCPLEIRVLRNSRHVATLDYDALKIYDSVLSLLPRELR